MDEVSILVKLEGAVTEQQDPFFEAVAAPKEAEVALLELPTVIVVHCSRETV